MSTNLHTWTIAEGDDVWQDTFRGTLADVWHHVGETINNIAAVPTAEQLAAEPTQPEGTEALWVGTWEHVDPNRVRVVYWHDLAGEGPTRVEAEIAVFQPSSEDMFPANFKD
jgi:hypothetical protein